MIRRLCSPPNLPLSLPASVITHASRLVGLSASLALRSRHDFHQTQEWLGLAELDCRKVDFKARILFLSLLS